MVTEPDSFNQPLFPMDTNRGLAHCVIIGMLQLLLLAALPLAAQPLLSVYDVDPSNFPTIRAKFYAIDASGGQVQGLTPGDFTITEDGIPRTVTGVNCPPQKPPIPLTAGVMVDTYQYIDIAGAGIRHLTGLLRMPPAQVGITTMDQGVFIVQDYTMDRAKAIGATEHLISSPGTHLQRIFYDANAGGVPLITGRPNKKALILLTDLHCPMFDLDTAKLWEDAARENISVYMVLFNANDYFGLFHRIAERTGGKVFEHVTTAEEMKGIVEEIALTEQYQPCQVEWRSEYGCTLVRETRMSLGRIVKDCRIPLTDYAGSVPLVDIEPSNVSFGGVTPGSYRDTTVTLTAVHRSVSVTGIASDNSAFTVTGDSASHVFTLQAGESRQISLRYSPVDSLVEYCHFTIRTDACYDNVILALGGYLELQISQTALKLLRPNGGEKFSINDTMEIEWQGSLPGDSLRLEYSVDAGRSWGTIIEGALGNSYRWNVPTTISDSCLLRIRQLRSSSAMLPLTGHRGDVTSARFSPDGLNVVTASSDGTARIWDAFTGRLIRTLVSNPEGASVRVADYSPDGARIATGSYDRTIKIWNATDGSLIRSIALSFLGDINSLNFSPDGKTIVAAGANPYSARIWDVTTGEVLGEITMGDNYPMWAEFSPDGKEIILSTTNYGNIGIWDVDPLAQRKNFHAHENDVQSASFNSRGDRIVSAGGNDAAIKIWNAQDYSLIRTLLGHTGTVKSARFDPTGEFVLSAGVDGTARIWNASTGEVVRNMIGHRGFLYEARYSPDGKRVATASADSTARIWGNDSLREDISDSLWSILPPQLTIETPEIDMGKVLVHASRDSVVRRALCNTGVMPLHILGVDATGGNTDDFMIMSGAGDFTLAPGECRDIVFTFMPMATGYREARFTVRAATGTIADKIHVSGEGAEVRLNVATDVIDFHRVDVGMVKDSSIGMILQNVGTEPITLFGSVLLGPDSTEFLVLPGGGNTVLAPGDSYPVSLRFAPSKIGRTSGRVAFGYDGVGSPAVVRLFGEGVAAEILPANPSLEYSPACEPVRDSSVDIYNSGNADLKIRGAFIAGKDAGDYFIQWPGSDSSATVLPGEHVSLVVRFVPRTSDTETAELVLASNALNAPGGTSSISLRGKRDSVGFVLSQPAITFTDVPIDDTATAVLALTNTGESALHWHAPIVIGAFTIESVTPSTTPPNGGTSQVTIRFNGGQEGDAFGADYSFTDQYCGTTQSLALSASVHATSVAELALPDIVAAPGDTVAIPIVLRNARFISQSGATGFVTSLRFDAAFLVPVPPTPEGTVVEGQRVIPLSLPLQPAANSSLATLTFRSPFGGNGGTDLLLEHSSAVGGKVALIERAGHFRVSTGGRIALDVVQPNPVTDVGSIGYKVAELGRTQLYVTDILGRRVATLVDGEMAPGGYVASFDAAGLPSGIYYCTLQTPTEKLVQAVEVRR